MRKTATLEDHAEMARRISQIERELSELEHKVIRCVPKKNVRHITRAWNAVGQLKSELENRMFAEHTELGNEWTRLYYGDAARIMRR